jgi:hypothetical protein
LFSMALDRGTPMFPLSTAPMGFDAILGNAL